MKDCIHLFIVYTLLQIVFSTLYYLVAATVNATLCIGACLYAIVMAATYLSYRDAAYKKHRQDLLDALL